MLGWFFVVHNLTPQELEALKPTGPDSTATLAHWETGPDGLTWIDRLAKTKKAQQLRFDGYPMRYALRFAEVRPELFAKAPPATPIIIGDDYVIPANWLGKKALFEDRIAACHDDQIVTIDVWDQS